MSPEFGAFIFFGIQSRTAGPVLAMTRGGNAVRLFGGEGVGQGEGEAASFFRFAFDGDGSAKDLDSHFAECQTQTGVGLSTEVSESGLIEIIYSQRQYRHIHIYSVYI